VESYLLGCQTRYWCAYTLYCPPRPLSICSLLWGSDNVCPSLLFNNKKDNKFMTAFSRTLVGWVGWWTIWWYITAAWWCRGQTVHQSSAPRHATWFVLRQWARFVLIVAAMTSAVAPFLQWVLRVYRITCSICIPKIIAKATETTGFSFTNKIHNLV
jgi:hypothetical protein